MRNNAKVIRLLLLFIFVSCIPIQIVQSSTQVGILYSYVENDPWYDGILEPTIWDTTRAIDVTLYDIADQEESMTISLLSIYNTVNGSLSFGIIVPDTTLNDDVLGIMFKTNTSADIVVYDDEWIFTAANDMKVVLFSYNETGDGITYGDELDGTNDIGVGGTEDSYGTGTWDGTQYIFEMHTFLNLTDPLGADYRLGENSQIEFFVLYVEDGTTTIFSQIRVDDGDFDYCILNIGAPPPSTAPTTLYIFSSLIASIIVISIIYRRKK